jgi:hypothetical protein
MMLISTFLAASTDIERGFSQGGLTVTLKRHSLNDESTRAATILGTWVDIDGLIPDEYILNLFREKGKRPRPSASADTAEV